VYFGYYVLTRVFGYYVLTRVI